MIAAGAAASGAIEAAGAVAGSALDVASDLKNKLTEKFSSVKISKKDLDKAERKIKGDLIDEWKENTVYNACYGVPKANIRDYVKSLKSVLKDLDEDAQEQVYDSLNNMAFADEIDHLVLNFHLKIDAVGSSYGYIVATKNPITDKLNFAYAIHMMRFKMAERRIEVKTQKKLFWLIPVGTTTHIEHEKVKFGEDDMERLKNEYCKHRALESLAKEGIINQITYDD